MENIEDIIIEEHTEGKYDFSSFILSKTEEKRIYKPWRRGVIVRLLGRRIGYHALETRLKQMWVQNGVVSIIDLSNDYYLVVFTNEDDHNELDHGKVAGTRVCSCLGCRSK